MWNTIMIPYRISNLWVSLRNLPRGSSRFPPNAKAIRVLCSSIMLWWYIFMRLQLSWASHYQRRRKCDTTNTQVTWWRYEAHLGFKRSRCVITPSRGATWAARYSLYNGYNTNGQGTIAFNLNMRCCLNTGPAHSSGEDTTAFTLKLYPM